MSPNNGILFNGVFKPKLLNNPSPPCSFTNLDFLLPHTAHFDDNIVLPVLVFNIFKSTLSVSTLSVLSNKSTYLITREKF